MKAAISKVEEKRVLLFCNFELPESCANAKRVFSFAKMLRDNGVKVEMLGVTHKEGEIDLSGKYDGFSYQMIYAPEMHGIKALKRTHILEEKLTEVLEKFGSSLDAVIISNVYFDFSRQLLSYSKKYRIPIFVNSVEWYDKNSDLFKGFSGKLRYLQNRYALIHIHKKMRNIITISSLLGDYYSHRGCNTCTIPTLVDMHEYSSLRKKSDGGLRIAYAGSPAKKDYVVNAVRALCLLNDDERSGLTLHFYGATVDDFIKLGLTEPEIEATRESVVFHGRIPHAEVRYRVAEADFTVLLRPNKRYANAGFPTKVGESMACGTPVITNLTSDLSRYVIDGVTGIVCENESAEACARAFRRALSLPSKSIGKMAAASREMAEGNFDYRNYSATLVQLIRTASVA